MTAESEHSDREQVLRDALARRAEAFGRRDHAVFAIPDQGGPNRRVDGMWRRWQLLAAAVIVVIMLGAALTAGSLLAFRGGRAPVGSPSAAPSQSPSNQPTRLPGAAAYSGLPAADPGWRWVSWQNVAVQVPASWPYDIPLLSDPCALPDPSKVAKRGPFVAIDASFVPVAAVGCIDKPATDFDAEFSYGSDRFWRPDVAFGKPTGADGRKTHKTWTLTTRTVGDVQVRVLATPQTQTLTARILDSARTFTTDQNGCAATSPIEADGTVRPKAAFDVATIARVDAISICRYRLIATDPAGPPGLSASRLIRGAAAQDLLAAIKAAPVGGGPDRPGTCIPQSVEAVVVRLHTGRAGHDLYVHYDSCIGNGFDDGTNLRELTRDACHPLFARLPLLLWAADTAVMGRCGS